MKKLKPIDHIINLRNACVPFLIMGYSCGLVEFVHLILYQDWDILHIGLTIGYSVIGGTLLCIASWIEHKEFNKVGK